MQIAGIIKGGEKCMKSHLIMPMGGAGSRFYKNGFMQPKPLIEISGKPFFYWSTLSISKWNKIRDLIYVVLQQHIDGFNLDSKIRYYFPDARIVAIPEVLPGPVFTALIGTDYINDNEPVVYNDCDHMFKSSKLNAQLEKEKISEDGALLTFESTESHFSYVKYDGDRIVGTVEKQVVSNHAICGCYIFRNASIFKKMASEYIEDCPYNECYMSGIYNVMLEKGLSVKEYILDYHVEYGTPEEFDKAKTSGHFLEYM